MVRLIAVMLLLLTATAAWAQERRMLGEEEAAAFRAVGRLNVAGSRFCTATLIAPAVIVTAAHCLFHPRTHAAVPVDEFRFVAGLRLGKTAAVRKVVRMVTQPDFTFAGIADAAGVRADLALLELEAPAPDDVEPFQPGVWDAEAGPLAIVSYARDRAQAPSTEDCVLATSFDGVAALECAVTYGASGAPVFRGEPGDRRLVGVVSAMGRVLTDNRDVTLAVLVGPWIEPLAAALDEAPREE